MELKFKEMLSQVTSFLEHEANSETVVGKPFKLGKFDCIPVVRIGMGFGSGAGGGDAPKQGHGEGGGAGAGMGIEPIGFLVTNGDQITFIASKSNKGIAAAFEKVPDLIEKFLDIKKNKEELVEA